MIHIGIDQSIGFTGITVYRPGAPTEHIYYGITHKKHTKWDKFVKTNSDKDWRTELITIIDYVREEHVEDYAEDERIKYRNISKIAFEISKIIEDLINDFPEDEIDVRLEGISFGSHATTAIAELAALNYFIRDICHAFGIQFTVIPPTKVKKFATGNGQADKDLMTASFLAVEPDMKELSKYIKMDDIADSYFMACYSE